MRRRKNEESLLDVLFDIFTLIPWWGGLIVVGLTYVLFSSLIPLFLTRGLHEVRGINPHQIFAYASSSLAPLLTLVVFVMWVVALFKRKSVENDEYVETESRVDKSKFKLRYVKQNSYSDTQWQDFEKLMGIIFEKEGYEVELLGGDQPDGGIDLILHKEQRKILVQCKHWKVQQVGVKVIRELLGVITSKRAHSGIVVTTGTFSQDAIEFAKSNSIELLDGSDVARLIKENEIPERYYQGMIHEQLLTIDNSLDPKCPKCSGSMLKRRAKKGSNQGSYFWGCSKYPTCKGTRTI